MSSINHITGGIVITGIFASFWDLNIISNSWYIIASIFFTLLPDIDHPKSLLGKIFFPISKYLDRNYGHRTITHGLLCFITIIFATFIIEKLLVKSSRYTTIAFFSYFSHLLFDMMTVQGIPLFYPFKRNPCVIPANRELRFKSGNLHTESIIFCILFILGFTCKDLFKNGFWTSYNKAFGSVKHLVKEFKRTTKLIKVHFHFSINGKTQLGEGFLIGSEQKKVYIYTQFEIIQIPYSAIIYQLDYEITKKNFETEDKYFYSISLNELYKLIAGKAIIKLKLNSNSDFITDHKEVTSSRQMNLSYITNPQFTLNNQSKEQKKKDLEDINQEIIDLKKKKKKLITAISEIKKNLKKQNLYERENQTLMLKNLNKEIESIDKIVIPRLEQKKILIQKSLNEKVELNGYMTYVKI